jgi:hypothetical protein
LKVESWLTQEDVSITPSLRNTNAVIARSAATKQSVTQDAFIVRDCFVALAMTALFVTNNAFSDKAKTNLIFNLI